MSSDNFWTGRGGLTRDFEVRYTQTGKAVATSSVACNKRYKKANGEWAEETTYIDIEVWDKLAEACGEKYRKGSRVMITGELKQDTWERDGQKRTRLLVRADSVAELPKFAKSQDQQQQSQQNQQPNPSETEDIPF